MGSVLMLVPPLDTQRRIARFLDGKTAGMSRLRDRIVQSMDRLHACRSALIMAAVTGRLAVDTPSVMREIPA